MQFKAQKDVPILNTAPYDQPQQSYENEYVGKYSARPSPNNNPSNLKQHPYAQEQTELNGEHEAGGPSGGRVFRSNSSITSTIRKPNVDDILNGDPLARAASEPAQKPASASEKKPAAPSYSSGKRRNSVDNASVDDLLAMIADQKKKL